MNISESKNISTMKYDVEPFIKTYMPSLIELIGGKNISWTKANRLLFNHVRKSHDKALLAGGEIIQNASFFTILKNKYERNSISDAMFDFYNFIFEELNKLLEKPERDLLQSTILNIMTEMSSNYLNFIGELAVLHIFKASGQFTLLSVEEKLHPEKDISADFLFRHIKSGEELLIEVLNLHLEKQDFKSIEHLRYWLYSKYKKKKEKKFVNNDRQVFIQPVIWVKSRKQFQNLEKLYCETEFLIDYVNTPMSYLTYLINDQKYEHRFEPVTTILKD